jgi:hypothetical protein
MLISKYPNYKCGECPFWLADISIEETIKHCEEKQCSLYLEGQVDCDGRCLNCDEFDHIRGCTVEEG